MDVKVGLAACSVSEGECNARKCGPIRAFVNSEYSINERNEKQ